MSASVADAGGLAETGSVARDLTFPVGWREELGRWLRRRPGHDPGPGGWVIALLPEFVERSLRFDGPALQVYQAVTWTASLPAEVRASVEPAWCSPAGERSEIAFRSRAARGSETLAEALLVARVAGSCAPSGARGLPRVPDAEGGRRRLSLVLDAEQVRTFARLAGTRYPIHDDPAAAHRLGYPDVLVQGAVLLLTVMHFGRCGDRGTAEMWFRRPVPAGTLLVATENAEEDSRIWALRLPNGEVAAVARISRESRPLMARRPCLEL